jgi:hypothetical protein
MIGYHGGHVPDISTTSGFHEIMMLGNLCEAGALVQRENYVSGMSPAALEEAAVARRRYRELQMWFVWRYTLVIRGDAVNPYYAFHYSLANFMAVLVVYKQKIEKEVPPVEGCSLKVLTKRVRAFLEAEHEELVHIWEHWVEKKRSMFYWNGPAFDVMKRSVTHHINESYEDDDHPIYHDGKDDDKVDSEDVESEDEEGDEDDVEMEDVEGDEDAEPSSDETSADGSTKEPRLEKRKVAPGMC